MLSSLVPSFLPSTVTDMFEPPLDASKLHLSLTQGALHLTNLRFNAAHINSKVLSPLSPVHVLSGSVRSLKVELDWKNLWSQPLLVTGEGLCLNLTHNTYESADKRERTGELQQALREMEETEEDRKKRLQREEAAYTAERKEGVREEEVAGATAAQHPSSTPGVPKEVSEEELLRLAVDAKKQALELAHPNALNMTPPSSLKLSSLLLSGTMKRLVNWVLRSLQLKMADIQIRYLHDNCELTQEKVKQTTPAAAAEVLSPTLTPSTVTTEGVTEDLKKLKVSPAALQDSIIGIDLVGILLESYKSSPDQLGLPSNLTVLKRLILTDFGVWCDSNGERTRATATPVSPSKPVKEAAPMPTAAHSYIVPPLSQEIHLANNGSLDVNLELLLKFLSPPQVVHTRPVQLQLLFSIASSLLQHLAATQTQLEAVAVRHFRLASNEERDRYIPIYKQQLQHKSLRGAQTSFLEMLEREVSFADLLAMRSIAFVQLEEEKLRERQQRVSTEQQLKEETTREEEVVEEPSETVEAQPKREPTLWETITHYFDFSSESSGAGSPTHKQTTAGTELGGAPVKSAAVKEEPTTFEKGVETGGRGGEKQVAEEITRRE